MSLSKSTTTTTTTRRGLGRSMLTVAEQHQLEDAFRLFDVNGNGVIDPQELSRVVASLENMPTHSKETMEELLQQRGNEPLDLEAFANLLTGNHRTLLSATDSPHDLRRIFDLFDSQRRGYLTVQDLQRVAHELGERMTDEELEEMIQRAAPDGDGRVGPDDFYAIMAQQLFS